MHFEMRRSGTHGSPNHSPISWVQRLESKYLLQGDKEKKETLAVSALVDRDKRGVKAAETGFCEMFVNPLFEAL